MEKCNCYEETWEIIGWLGPDEFIRKHRHRCNGTRERDECSCGGDRLKCDFYPEVRERAKKNVSVQDAINHFEYGISHDIFQEPVASYAEMAVSVLKKQPSTEKVVTNADRVRSMTDDELADFLVGSDSIVDDICHKGLCLDGETCVGCTLKWLKRPIKYEFYEGGL